MNFYAFSALVNLLSSILIGSFVLYKNPRNSINRNFNFFCYAVAFWSFGYIWWQITDNINDAMFWLKFLMVGAALAPIYYFTFVIHFLDLYKEKFYKILYWIFYLICLIFAILNIFTSLLVSSTTPRLNFPFWPNGGPIFIPFLLMFFGYVMYASYLLAKHYKNGTGIKKLQTKYIFIGIVFAFIAGSTNYFLWFNIPIPPFITGLVTIYPISIGYAILRYRLMDIRVVIKRSAVFTVLVLLITAIYAFVVVFLSTTFKDLIGSQSIIITGAFTAILIALGFEPIKKILQQTTDHFLFKGEYEPQKLLASLSLILSTTLDLNTLLSSVISTLSGAFRVGDMAVILTSREKKKDGFILGKKIGFDTLEKEFSNDHKLIEYFQDSKELLVLEEFKRKNASSSFNRKNSALIKDLEKNKIAVVLPLWTKNKLVGLFLIGGKKSDDMYTIEDLNILEIIGSQSAMAIENAQLYNEMKRFNFKLKKEVEKATHKLKEANKELLQLDQTKSEFISIASHQLRTPLTIIKGYVSMMLEGSFGKLNPQEIDSLDKVYKSNERLIKLVEELLDVSRIESGRMEFDFQPLHLEDLVESTIEELKPQALNKKLYFEFKKLEEMLPPVKGDAKKLKEVISNMIDNSIKYTQKGGIRVRLKAEKGKIIFQVSDTGVGIDPEEMPILFKKFSRAKGMSLLHTEGTGLGLFVAKKIMEAHNGKIWVESPGRGKGSTFSFSLAVYDKNK